MLSGLLNISVVLGSMMPAGDKETLPNKGIVLHVTLAVAPVMAADRITLLLAKK